jgi:hypothetical protein
MSGGIPVYLEVGTKRVFACAIDWPGWCRSAKDEPGALQALGSAAPRYALVARTAGIAFPAATNAGLEFEVVQRLNGSASTDFGVPGESTRGDAEPLDAKETERLCALVAASWVVFDGVVAKAPAELTKGPRGGGRDRDKMVDHVIDAEAGAYAPKLGVRLKSPAYKDAAAVDAGRKAILDGLRALAKEGPPADPKGWNARYAARRIAWHVLDHAWEMEDRTERPGS